MTYARIVDDELIHPFRVPNVLDRIHDLRDADAGRLAEFGIYEVVEVPRPADTDTTTHDLTVEVVDGVPSQVWTERLWTQDELAAIAAREARDARDTFLRNAIGTLETWSRQADNHTVTQLNAVATVQTIVDNLAVFYDGFAKLLRNQYGIDD